MKRLEIDGRTYIGETNTDGKPSGVGMVIDHGTTKFGNFDGSLEVRAPGLMRKDNGDLIIFGEGVGAFYFADSGDRYEGEIEFESLNRTGFGLYTWERGSTFSGQFSKGVAVGLGILQNPRGTSFLGQFDHNLPNGYGCQFVAQGSFQGQFLRGKRSGFGAYTDGKVENKGQWKDDELVTFGDFDGRVDHAVLEAMKAMESATSILTGSLRPVLSEIERVRGLVTKLCARVRQIRAAVQAHLGLATMEDIPNFNFDIVLAPSTLALSLEARKRAIISIQHSLSGSPASPDISLPLTSDIGSASRGRRNIKSLTTEEVRERLDQQLESRADSRHQWRSAGRDLGYCATEQLDSVSVISCGFGREPPRGEALGHDSESEIYQTTAGLVLPSPVKNSVKSQVGMNRSSWNNWNVNGSELEDEHHGSDPSFFVSTDRELDNPQFRSYPLHHSSPETMSQTAHLNAAMASSPARWLSERVRISDSGTAPFDNRIDGPDSVFPTPDQFFAMSTDEKSFLDAFVPQDSVSESIAFGGVISGLIAPRRFGAPSNVAQIEGISFSLNTKRLNWSRRDLQFQKSSPVDYQEDRSSETDTDVNDVRGRVAGPQVAVQQGTIDDSAMQLGRPYHQLGKSDFHVLHESHSREKLGYEQDWTVAEPRSSGEKHGNVATLVNQSVFPNFAIGRVQREDDFGNTFMDDFGNDGSEANANTAEARIAWAAKSNSRAEVRESRAPAQASMLRFETSAIDSPIGTAPERTVTTVIEPGVNSQPLRTTRVKILDTNSSALYGDNSADFLSLRSARNRPAEHVSSVQPGHRHLTPHAFLGENNGQGWESLGIVSPTIDSGTQHEYHSDYAQLSEGHTEDTATLDLHRHGRLPVRQAEPSISYLQQMFRNSGGDRASPTVGQMIDGSHITLSGYAGLNPAKRLIDTSTGGKAMALNHTFRNDNLSFGPLRTLTLGRTDDLRFGALHGEAHSEANLEDCNIAGVQIIRRRDFFSRNDDQDGVIAQHNVAGWQKRNTFGSVSNRDVNDYEDESFIPLGSQPLTIAGRQGRRAAGNLQRSEDDVEGISSKLGLSGQRRHRTVGLLPGEETDDQGANGSFIELDMTSRRGRGLSPENETESTGTYSKLSGARGRRALLPGEDVDADMDGSYSELISDQRRGRRAVGLTADQEEADGAYTELTSAGRQGRRAAGNLQRSEDDVEGISSKLGLSGQRRHRTVGLLPGAETDDQGANGSFIELDMTSRRGRGLSPENETESTGTYSKLTGLRGRRALLPGEDVDADMDGSYSELISDQRRGRRAVGLTADQEEADGAYTELTSAGRQGRRAAGNLQRSEDDVEGISSKLGLSGQRRHRTVGLLPGEETDDHGANGSFIELDMTSRRGRGLSPENETESTGTYSKLSGLRGRRALLPGEDVDADMDGSYSELGSNQRRGRRAVGLTADQEEADGAYTELTSAGRQGRRAAGNLQRSEDDVEGISSKLGLSGQRRHRTVGLLPGEETDDHGANGSFIELDMTSRRGSGLSPENETESTGTYSKLTGLRGRRALLPGEDIDADMDGSYSELISDQRRGRRAVGLTADQEEADGAYTELTSAGRQGRRAAGNLQRSEDDVEGISSKLGLSGQRRHRTVGLLPGAETDDQGANGSFIELDMTSRRGRGLSPENETESTGTYSKLTGLRGRRALLPGEDVDADMDGSYSELISDQRRGRRAVGLTADQEEADGAYTELTSAGRQGRRAAGNLQRSEDDVEGISSKLGLSGQRRHRTVGLLPGEETDDQGADGSFIELDMTSRRGRGLSPENETESTGTYSKLTGLRGRRALLPGEDIDADMDGSYSELISDQRRGRRAVGLTGDQEEADGAYTELTSAGRQGRRAAGNLLPEDDVEGISSKLGLSGQRRHRTVGLLPGEETDDHGANGSFIELDMTSRRGRGLSPENETESTGTYSKLSSARGRRALLPGEDVDADMDGSYSELGSNQRRGRRAVGLTADQEEADGAYTELTSAGRQGRRAAGNLQRSEDDVEGISSKLGLSGQRRHRTVGLLPGAETDDHGANGSFIELDMTSRRGRGLSPENETESTGTYSKLTGLRGRRALLPGEDIDADMDGSYSELISDQRRGRRAVGLTADQEEADGAYTELTSAGRQGRRAAGNLQRSEDDVEGISSKLGLSGQRRHRTVGLLPGAETDDQGANGSFIELDMTSRRGRGLSPENETESTGTYSKLSGLRGRRALLPGEDVDADMDGSYSELGSNQRRGRRAVGLTADQEEADGAYTELTSAGRQGRRAAGNLQRSEDDVEGISSKLGLSGQRRHRTVGLLPGEETDDHGANGSFIELDMTSRRGSGLSPENETESTGTYSKLSGLRGRRALLPGEDVDADMDGSYSELGSNQRRGRRAVGLTADQEEADGAYTELTSAGRQGRRAAGNLQRSEDDVEGISSKLGLSGQRRHQTVGLLPGEETDDHGANGSFIELDMTSRRGRGLSPENETESTGTYSKLTGLRGRRALLPGEDIDADMDGSYSELISDQRRGRRAVGLTGDQEEADGAYTELTSAGRQGRRAAGNLLPEDDVEGISSKLGLSGQRRHRTVGLLPGEETDDHGANGSFIELDMTSRRGRGLSPENETESTGTYSKLTGLRGRRALLPGEDVDADMDGSYSELISDQRRGRRAVGLTADQEEADGAYTELTSAGRQGRRAAGNLQRSEDDVEGISSKLGLSGQRRHRTVGLLPGEETDDQGADGSFIELDMTSRRGRGLSPENETESTGTYSKLTGLRGRRALLPGEDVDADMDGSYSELRSNQRHGRRAVGLTSGDNNDGEEPGDRAKRAGTLYMDEVADDADGMYADLALSEQGIRQRNGLLPPSAAEGVSGSSSNAGHNIPSSFVELVKGDSAQFDRSFIHEGAASTGYDAARLRNLGAVPLSSGFGEDDGLFEQSQDGSMPRDSRSSRIQGHRDDLGEYASLTMAGADQNRNHMDPDQHRKATDLEDRAHWNDGPSNPSTLLWSNLETGTSDGDAKPGFVSLRKATAIAQAPSGNDPSSMFIELSNVPTAAETRGRRVNPDAKSFNRSSDRECPEHSQGTDPNAFQTLYRLVDNDSEWVTDTRAGAQDAAANARRGLDEFGPGTFVDLTPDDALLNPANQPRSTLVGGDGSTSSAEGSYHSLEKIQGAGVAPDGSRLHQASTLRHPSESVHPNIRVETNHPGQFRDIHYIPDSLLTTAAAAAMAQKRKVPTIGLYGSLELQSDRSVPVSGEINSMNFSELSAAALLSPNQSTSLVKSSELSVAEVLSSNQRTSRVQVEDDKGNKAATFIESGQRLGLQNSPIRRKLWQREEGNALPKMHDVALEASAVIKHDLTLTTMGSHFVNRQNTSIGLSAETSPLRFAQDAAVKKPPSSARYSALTVDDFMGISKTIVGDNRSSEHNHSQRRIHNQVPMTNKWAAENGAVANENFHESDDSLSVSSTISENKAQSNSSDDDENYEVQQRRRVATYLAKATFEDIRMGMLHPSKQDVPNVSVSSARHFRSPDKDTMMNQRDGNPTELGLAERSTQNSGASSQVTEGFEEKKVARPPPPPPIQPPDEEPLPPPGSPRPPIRPPYPPNIPVEE